MNTVKKILKNFYNNAMSKNTGTNQDGKQPSANLKQETPRTLSHTSKKSAAHRNPNSPSRKYFYPYRYRKMLDEISVDDIDFKEKGVVKDNLNDAIWEGGELKSEVRISLLKAARDFYEFLKIEAKIHDIILVGSMAHYTYNETSDIDVHLVIDYNDIDDDEDLVSEYLHSKKSVWNSKYDIKIKGHEIELYAQDLNQDTRSNGEYSIAKNKWNTKPKKKSVEIDVRDVKKKAAAMIGMIEKAEAIKDYEKLNKMVDRISDKIWDARSAALETEKEELSAANLAFKYLRSKGYLDRLSDLKTNAFNDHISIEEKKMIKESIEEEENILEVEDGCHFNDEQIETIKDFACFVQDKLKMESSIKISLLAEPHEGMTTAAYSPYHNWNYVVCKNRAMVDVLRSVAHELTHNRQRELGLFKAGDPVQDHDSRPNSIEGEANAMAGCLIKDYAKNYGNKHIYKQ